MLGAALLVAGLAEMIHVSAAVGAFLVGIGISGPADHRAESLLAPVRDLFAAVFFVFFGLVTDPSVLPGVIIPVRSARGEFSIIIAGLGIAAGGSSRQSAIAAGHVLLTATLGQIMALAVNR